MSNKALEYYIECIETDTRILQRILNTRIYNYRHIGIVVPIQAALRRATKSARRINTSNK